MTVFLFINSFSKIAFNKKANFKNSECCIKQRPRKANIFYLLPLTSVWGRTVNFNILFLVYTHYDALLSCLHVVYFLCRLRLRCCNFCWLNTLLFLRANYSQGFSLYYLFQTALSLSSALRPVKPLSVPEVPNLRDILAFAQNDMLQFCDGDKIKQLL